MVPESNPVVLRRELAKYFRDLRYQEKYELELVAERLGCSTAKISRLENGSRGIGQVDLEKLCDLYAIDKSERARLAEMAKESRKRAPVPSLGLPSTFSDTVQMEQAATAISEYNTSVVPGLLQTKAYATASVLGYGLNQSAATTRAAIDVRLARQQVLVKKSPPELWVVVDEAALARVVGGLETMRDQLNHLREMGTRPNVSIQVIPFAAGAHPGLNSNFILLEFGQDLVPDVVFVEGQVGSLVRDKPDDLAKYRRTWQQLIAMAMSPDDSDRHIAQLAERMR